MFRNAPNHDVEDAHLLVRIAEQESDEDQDANREHALGAFEKGMEEFSDRHETLCREQEKLHEQGEIDAVYHVVVKYGGSDYDDCDGNERVPGAGRLLVRIDLKFDERFHVFFLEVRRAAGCDAVVRDSQLADLRKDAGCGEQHDGDDQHRIEHVDDRACIFLESEVVFLQQSGRECSPAGKWYQNAERCRNGDPDDREVFAGNPVLIHDRRHGEGQGQRAEEVLYEHEEGEEHRQKQRLLLAGCKPGDQGSESHQTARVLQELHGSSEPDQDEGDELKRGIGKGIIKGANGAGQEIRAMQNQHGSKACGEHGLRHSFGCQR